MTEVLLLRGFSGAMHVFWLSPQGISKGFFLFSPGSSGEIPNSISILLRY